MTAGDLLITFDIEAIQAAGYLTETPVIITNQDAFMPAELPSLPTTVVAGQTLLAAVKK